MTKMACGIIIALGRLCALTDRDREAALKEPGQDRQLHRWTEMGRVSHPDGLSSEIGKELRTNQALRRERDFISAVLDTAGALVVVLDRGGRREVS
jgi:PAS domain-containing protein